MQITGGLHITGSGFSIGADSTPTFTITGSDFTNYNNWNSYVVPNGTAGFGVTNPTSLWACYIGSGLSPTLATNLESAMIAAGIDPTYYTGYIWNVSWGAGSTHATGKVKFDYNKNSGEFYIITIDETDTNWQNDGSVAGTSLTGTFNFPATFTLYTPLTAKSDWC